MKFWVSMWIYGFSLSLCWLVAVSIFISSAAVKYLRIHLSDRLYLLSFYSSFDITHGKPEFPVKSSTPDRCSLLLLNTALPPDRMLLVWIEDNIQKRQVGLSFLVRDHAWDFIYRELIISVCHYSAAISVYDRRHGSINQRQFIWRCLNNRGNFFKMSRLFIRMPGIIHWTWRFWCGHRHINYKTLLT